LGLDRWLSRLVALSSNALGQRRLLPAPRRLLSVHVSPGAAVEALPASVLVARNLGSGQALRISRLHLAAATVLAFTVTILMFSAWLSNALWALNWLLLVPVWFLVVTARRSQVRLPLAA